MRQGDFQVVWPLGKRRATAERAAAVQTECDARPVLDLHHVKIAFVWTYNRKGDEMFEIIKAMLRSEYPDISFIEYDTFGNIHGANESKVVAALPHLLRQHKADVAVIGIGG